MKNHFKYYVTLWAILVVIFNVIIFTVTGQTTGFTDLEPSYWIGYVFIMLAFAGNLAFGIYFFNENDRSKVFLNLSAMNVCYTALGVQFVVGLLTMLLSFVPYWVGIIVNLAVLAFYVSEFVKAMWASNTVKEIDKKIKVKTFFIKDLTAQAEGTVARAVSDEARAAATKVYEAIRYSDPMSDENLSDIETHISIAFSKFNQAVENDDIAQIKDLSDSLVVLIGDRNRKCKILK